MSATTPALDQIGVEVEYPLRRSSRRFQSAAGRSSDLANEFHRGSHFDGPGVMTYDSTVGAEIICDGPRNLFGTSTDGRDMTEWYRDVIEYCENLGYSHEPCGELVNSTAGMHIHLSHMTDQERDELIRLSNEPWMKLFVCSSITDDDWRLLRRSPYAPTIRATDSDSGGILRGRGGVGHYEWRMPEPVTVEHFSLIMEFLRTFASQGAEDARDFARGLVMEGDDRLTNIRRAKANPHVLDMDPPQRSVELLQEVV